MFYKNHCQNTNTTHDKAEKLGIPAKNDFVPRMENLKLSRTTGPQGHRAPRVLKPAGFGGNI